MSFSDPKPAAYFRVRSGARFDFLMLGITKFEAPEVENLGVQIKPIDVDVLKNSFSKSFLGSVFSNLALCWVTPRSCKSYPTFAPQRMTKSDFLL